MSLLQIDDALCHWLAGHNVILDFLENGEPWPRQVADVAGLLCASFSASGPTMVSSASASAEEEGRRLEFVNTVCASAREWRKTRSGTGTGEQFPWAHILAGLLEEVVTDATTYFDCEFVMPRPEASTTRKRGRNADRYPLRGTASLLVLVEVGSSSPSHSHSGEQTDPVCHHAVAKEQTRQIRAATVGRASHRSKDPALATPNYPSVFDEDGSLFVDLSLTSSASDVTLYDIVEQDGSELSVGVEIEDVPEGRKRMAVYYPKGAPNVFRVVDLDDVPSVDTEYSSISRFHTATSRSCSCSSSGSSTTDTYLARRVLPWTLYDDLTASDLELHLFPSPFHPKPLMPLLCVGDERNVVPLMCSALHQRRALRRDVPVVGILLPRNGSTCEVLLGWMESEPRPGRTLSRIRICARGLSSRIPTVFDLERPYSAFCLVQFLARLGEQTGQLRGRRERVPGETRRGWRADTYFESGLAEAYEESEARIRLWAYEVGCCNQIREEDDRKCTEGDGDSVISSASRPSRANRRADNEQLVKLLRQSVANLFVAELAKAPRRSRSPASRSGSHKTLVDRSTKTLSVTADVIQKRQAKADSLGRFVDASSGDSRAVSWCSSCSDGSDESDIDTLWQRAYHAFAFWS